MGGGAPGTERSPGTSQRVGHYLAGGMGIPAPGHQDQQLGCVLFQKLLTLREDRQAMCRPSLRQGFSVLESWPFFFFLPPLATLFLLTGHASVSAWLTFQTLPKD